MNALKAIETSYNGYRFRSRLEARWAVFFDALGVKWEYEKEGFQLTNGWYLPDFFIESWSCFVEIKPEISAESLVLCEELHRLSDKMVLLIAGRPWIGEHAIYDIRDVVTDVPGYDIGLKEDPGVNWWYTSFARCRRCDGFCLLSDGELSGFRDIGDHTCRDHDKWPADLLEGSYKKARSARFEHGEKP